MNMLLLALSLLVGTGLLALLCARRPKLSGVLGASGLVGGAFLGLLAALSVLLGAKTLSLSWTWQVPAGHFALNLDPLAAFFVLPICLLAILAAVYATGYLKDHSPAGAVGPHWFFLNLMVATMILVVVAANAVLFLMAWEGMTLSSFFLVAFEHRQKEVREAAWTYLVVAHLGLMLLLAFFLSAGGLCGGFDFADFRSLEPLPTLTAALLLVAGIGGFGVKAGLFPLHVWLPDAHPAAPSHVSALMSGVLVKVGIYGILRICGFLPALLPQAGIALMALGGVGALYGIAMANFQRDIKRALAYSTIENVGIVFLGLGLGLYAKAQGQTLLAFLGLAGALLHIWNHALFKGLLFLGAGSVLHATSTRDMDRLGGLLKKMPWTGAMVIGGSLAISALPPFNGLVSEWLIYLGLLGNGIQTGGFIGLLPLLMVGILGLIGALAVVAFTRLCGIVLLGAPRSEAALHAHEASASMLGPMAILLSLCLLIGLFPHRAVALLASPLEQLLPGSREPLADILSRLSQFGRWNALIWMSLGLFAALLFWLRRHRPLRQGGTWGCGFAFLSSRIEYTGEGYAELAQSHLVPPSLGPEVQRKPLRAIFPRVSRLAQQSPDPVLIRLFLPGVGKIAERCVRLRWLQQGKLQVYLLYIFMACALLMVWSVLAGKGLL